MAVRTDAFQTIVFSLSALLLTAILSALAFTVPLLTQKHTWLCERVAKGASTVFIFAAGILARELLRCWRRSYVLRALPGPKLPFLLGMAAMMLQRRDHHRLLVEWADKHGPIYRTRFIIFHAVVITDPLLAMRMMRTRKADKFPFVYKQIESFLGGNNLLTGQTDEHWRVVRKGVAPAFSPANMRQAFVHVAAAATKLANVLQEAGPQQEHNMETALLGSSMDVIGKVGFNQDLNNVDALRASYLKHSQQEQKGESAAQLLLDCTHSVEANFNEILWSARIWRADVRASWRHLAGFKGLIRRILHSNDRQGSRERSFASLLRQVNNPKTGRPLTEQEMLPEYAALFFAGSDTTAHTLVWALFLILQHPEVEAKIVAELAGLGLVQQPETSVQELQYADLGNLPYLQAVIKETLRLYPPVAVGQIRITHEPMSLGPGMPIPAGTLLWVPHLALHTADCNWDRAKEFVPERWLEATGVEYAKSLPLPPEFYGAQLEMGDATEAVDDLDADAVGSRARRYMPFGEGPRNCVGQALAKIALPITLATLLSRFTFQLAPRMGGPAGVRASEVYTLVTGTKDGLYMLATPRVPAS